ncbi:MAG: branched-chain amino acid ABC transporter permease [Syntrophorhabdales bacterium]
MEIFGIPAASLVQSFVNGLSLGWIYILIAMGLSLVFGTMRILQFAHGEVYMLGAYAVYDFVVLHGLPFLVAMPLCMATGLVLGLILERFFFRPLGGEFLPTIMIALGVMIVLQAIATVGFGVTPKSIPSFAPHAVEVLGLRLGSDRLIAVAVSIALILLLYFFLKRTKLGLALTAAAQHREASLLMGISPTHMSLTAMAVGSAMASVAGGLMGSIFPINPVMGGTALMKGLIIIILGGMGSLPGVVVGGLVLGFIDGVAPVVSGPATAALAPLFIVTIILVLRPQGLFGHE